MLNAIEKMQKEGEITEFAFDCALRNICPSAYQLKDKYKSDPCAYEGNKQNKCLGCWSNALTTDYEGVDD